MGGADWEGSALPCPPPKMSLTILIPFRNGQEYVPALLRSLPVDIPILFVDDQSDPPFVAPKMANVRSIRLEQRGYFSGAVNAGIQATQGDVLVLNQDVTLQGTDWLNLITEQREQFALIGDGVFNHPFLPKGYVQGTFMFMRRDAIDAVGLLNAEEYPLWGATAEWQVRAARKEFFAKPVRMSEYGMRHARGEQPYGSSIKATLKEQPEETRRFIQTPPLVSVVITCYNYGRYLTDAVNSLIGGATCLGNVPPQTLQSFEIIIVDDGSTDDTLHIAGQLADPRKAIRFATRNNGGSSAAANTGIKLALGKYITVLDADDMMEPTRLEKLVAMLRKHPHSVAYDDIYWMQPTEEGKWVKSLVYELSPYDFDKMLTRNAMHKGIMYPRQAWQEAGGYPERMRDGREDWAVNIALGVKGYCGEHLKEPLYIYRRHDKNRTRTNTTQEWREYHMGQLNDLFPDIYAGVRPMGCCGSGNRNKPSNGNGAQAQMAARLNVGGNLLSVGSQGMIQLEYLLNRAGTQVFNGAVTRAAYVFGGSRKIGYVDQRDAEALLDLREGQRAVFRQIATAPTEVPKPNEQELLTPQPLPASLTMASVGVTATGTVVTPAIEGSAPVASPRKPAARKSAKKKSE